MVMQLCISILVSVLITRPLQSYQPGADINKFLVHLRVEDTTGCFNSAYKWLTVVSMCKVVMTAAFTPNNDGLNAYLQALNTYKMKKMAFKVFNRNGQLVFESNSTNGKWDGRVNDADA